MKIHIGGGGGRGDGGSFVSAERPTQTERVLALLRAARGGWVPNRALNEIAFRYGGRIMELRRAGYGIEMRAADAAHGLYEYRLVSEPATAGQERGVDPVTVAPSGQGSLFAPDAYGVERGTVGV
jgi:hypothetical protein